MSNDVYKNWQILGSDKWVAEQRRKDDMDAMKIFLIVLAVGLATVAIVSRGM